MLIQIGHSIKQDILNQKGTNLSDSRLIITILVSYLYQIRIAVILFIAGSVLASYNFCVHPFVQWNILWQ